MLMDVLNRRSSLQFSSKDPMTFDIAVAPATCGGLNNGSLTVKNFTNGVSPYKLTIVSGGISTTQAGVVGSYQFTNLSANYYSLTVTDANNCTTNYSNPDNSGNSIALQSPTDIRFSLVITNPLCSNGNATVNVTPVTGGSGVYQYSINNGVTWQQVISLTSISPLLQLYDFGKKCFGG